MNQINNAAAMLIRRAMIQSEQVLGGTLSFGTPQFIAAHCPNLTLEFSVGFTFNGFTMVDGTLNLAARATVRSNGMGRMLLCLSNLRLLGLTIPGAPALQSLAMGAVAQLLPGELCVDVTGALSGLGINL